MLNEDLKHDVAPLSMITLYKVVLCLNATLPFKKPPNEETLNTYILFSLAFVVFDGSNSQHHGAT